MIKYKLFCKNCDKNFDSWFASSIEFEKIKRMKLLNCHQCNSKNIVKSLMAPNILNSKKEEKLIEDKKHSKIKNKIREYQKFIKKNFEYVGDNFAYEARTLHYSKDKSKKNIYGNSNLKEVKELKEEGIETEIIPWVKDLDN